MLNRRRKIRASANKTNGRSISPCGTDQEESVPSYTNEEHALFIEERKGLIDAARESSRTFDQAVLAFGSAVFAGSIAFLKDVAPRPERSSLKFLALSWFLLASGLLAVLLSFLFSHRACMFEIDSGLEALSIRRQQRAENPWSKWVDLCNYLCIGLLFTGVVLWSVYAFKNLAREDSVMKNLFAPLEPVKKGYVPPKAPPPPPKQSITPPSPPAGKK